MLSLIFVVISFVSYTAAMSWLGSSGTLLHMHSTAIGKVMSSVAIATTSMMLSASEIDEITPEPKDNAIIQQAFRDFDLKKLDDSEKEFSTAIARWREMNRPRDEIVVLLKARYTIATSLYHTNRCYE